MAKTVKIARLPVNPVIKNDNDLSDDDKFFDKYEAIDEDLLDQERKEKKEAEYYDVYDYTEKGKVKRYIEKIKNKRI